MANIQSQIKRNRQNERRRERNKGVRTLLKTEAKRARAAAEGGDQEAAETAYRAAARRIDKAVSKGALSRSTAARRKSRLAKQISRQQPD